MLISGGFGIPIEMLQNACVSPTTVVEILLCYRMIMHPSNAVKDTSTTNSLFLAQEYIQLLGRLQNPVSILPTAPVKPPFITIPSTADPCAPCCGRQSSTQS